MGNRNPYLLIMFLLVHIILQIVPIWAAQSPYIPMDHIVLDCGASTASSLSNGQKWNLQNSSKFEYSKELDATSVSRVQSSGEPYVPKSYACINQKQYTYTFPASAGMNFVRLHFYPTSYFHLNVSNALFSVNVGTYTLLNISNFSYSTNASDIEYTIKEFCINLDSPILNITFTPSRSILNAYGFVNKIEVVSMPPNLYVQEGVDLTLIGHPTKFNIGKSTALEMMYRLNVGGKFIPAEDDTGMFRIWLDDISYLNPDSTISSTIRSKIDITYSSSVPAYTAPLNVYATARTMEPNRYFNLSWAFPLDSGFYYLIRLHFCEIRMGTKDNKRAFRLYINNQMVEEHADVIQWSGGAGVPVYRDYIVNFSRRSQEHQNLLLELENQTVLTINDLAVILNGLEIFKLSDHSNNLAGVLSPFGSRNSKSDRSSKRNAKIVIIPFALVASLVGLPSLCYIFLYFLVVWCPSPLTSLLHRCKWERRTFMQWASSNHCRYFSLAEIKTATDNFSNANLIGDGGFGKVYKGYIDKGATTVAIKRGSPTSHQGLHEFQTEITMLSELRHRHIVSLIGYCMDNKEMVLVYEFIGGGALRDHLYNTQKPPLPWKQRLKVCIGAARGLHYLHTDTKQTIIHRDVKTTNILLDKRWVAKVADFGLSKVGPNMLSHTHVSTMVKGSFGYLDPEYYRRQKLTEKSDVYSFGVVLFEVLCARPAVLPTVPESEEDLQQVSLAEWALRCLQMGNLDQIIDPYLRGKVEPECLKTFTEIARKCLAERGNERPPMSDVVWNLELAWQQQEVADAIKEGRMGNCTAQSIGGVGHAVMDGCIFNSDPMLGAEFSEIMFPIGR